MAARGWRDGYSGNLNYSGVYMELSLGTRADAPSPML